MKYNKSNCYNSRGLNIVCKKDENLYELCKKVTDEELDQINLHMDSFHGEWNYWIAPQSLQIIA